MTKQTKHDLLGRNGAATPGGLQMRSIPVPAIVSLELAARVPDAQRCTCSGAGHGGVFSPRSCRDLPFLRACSSLPRPRGPHGRPHSRVTRTQLQANSRSIQ